MSEDRALREKFEAMSHEEKKAFIRSQNPKLVVIKNKIPRVIKKHGPERWGYRLDCGWGFMFFSTSVEACERYNEFMERVK